VPSQLQLSRAHRAGQDQISRALANLLLVQYRRYITAGSTPEQIQAWIDASLPLVNNAYGRSAGLSGVFYARSRSLVGATGAPPSARAETLADEAVITGLMVTGVVGLMNKLEAGMPPALALKQSGDAAVGSAVKRALSGGRTYIQDVVTKDKTAFGYYRQTREGCCSFCAVLASRGAVFKEDSFKDSDPDFANDPDLPSTEKVHDRCHCSLWPVWRRTEDPLEDAPEQSKDFRALWDAVVNPGGRTAYSGKDALNAFRRAYDATLAAA
jgi:hypothetical protein